MNRTQSITAIDVGSSKIVTLIGQVSPTSQRINVVGASSVESSGVRKGQIVDIEQAADAIIKSVEGAERMAGFSVSKLFVSVSGNHICSQNSRGVVAVGGPQNEITPDDVRRVVEAARAISLPSSQEIIHVLPRYYNVDSQEGVADPVGMSGVRLEVETHIITGSSTSIKNLSKCVGEIGAGIGGLIYSGLASADATLTETEKELGVLMIDFGGGTTSLVVFIEGSPAYASVLPFGAKHVTNDLAVGLRLSLDNADKLKKLLNKEYPKDENPFLTNMKQESDDRNVRVADNDEIDLAKLGIYDDTKKVSRKTIIEGIIKPRLTEIFNLIAIELQKSGFVGLTPAGVVLTGGGSMVTGAIEACKKSLSLPVRLGTPGNIAGLIDDISSPAYSCAVGLLMYGTKQDISESGNLTFSGISKITKKVNIGNTGKKILGYLKSFLP